MHQERSSPLSLTNRWRTLFRHSRLFIAAPCFMSAARFLKVITFFLPLKILIILTTPSESGLKTVFQQFSGDYFMPVLIGLVPVVYLLYILLDLLSKKLLSTDFKRQQRSMEENTTGAEQAIPLGRMEYQMISGMLSEILLIAAGMLIMLVFAPALMPAVLVVTLATQAILRRILARGNRRETTGRFNLTPRSQVDLITSLAFITTFFAIIVISGYFNLGVFSAILSLLLSRMMLQALQRFSMFSIRTQKLHLKKAQP